MQLVRSTPHPGVLTRLLTLAAAAAIAASTLTIASAAIDGGSTTLAAESCQLASAKGDIKHVIYLIFDNVHFRRDNPNVPSDVEQMPNLLNFIRNDGTLMTNDHTVLISHTANGILTNLTGMYSDRHGQAVANSYRYFRADGSTGSSPSFKYWTDGVDGGNAATTPPTPSSNTNFNMVTGDSGSPKNTPAPWVPYTRAGCDFGATALANVVLENNNALVFAAGPTNTVAAAALGATNIKVASTAGFQVGMQITIDAGVASETATIVTVGSGGASGTGLTLSAGLTTAHISGVTVYGPTATDQAGDMTTVFGEGSPEWNEGRAAQLSNPGTAQRNLGQTDFVGIAIHCAKTTQSLCADNDHARPDPLPDEPDGYNGYEALFGAKYVNPAITGGNAAVNNLDGNPVGDQFGQVGFPGFDGLFASTTLGYVAQMQEAGVPITFGYISDAHDKHGVAGEIHVAQGPGEAAYVQQLKAYDTAFGKFFARLAGDGINTSNTLFVFTNEEGDHFVGDPPVPASCDGVTTPCTYARTSEINANLAGLMATQQGITTPFTVHSDMSPTIYLTGNPTRDAAVTRTFGRGLGNLTAVSPYTGETDELGVALADPVGMKALHMVTADPQRTPTLVLFSDPDYFFFAGAPNCTSPCITVPSTGNFTFAWNHGGTDPEIATTWLGIVGPGVKNRADDATWMDHADVRPTMLRLLGLQDTYVHDGRVLTDQLHGWALPASLLVNDAYVTRLGAAYKQLNAPFGQFSMEALRVSTVAIKSNAAGDATYTELEDAITDLTDRRDALAHQIRGALDGAAFGGRSIKIRAAQSWIAQANTLIADMAALGH
jgi:hypothetical protein